MAWKTLLSKIPLADIAIIDGRRGLQATLRNIWPATKIQRCYFHIQFHGAKYLTRRPIIELNKTLQALNETTAWLQHFHVWYQTHSDFLKHRSYLATTATSNRPKSLRTGQTSEYVHHGTRSAYLASNP